LGFRFLDVRTVELGEELDRFQLQGKKDLTAYWKVILSNLRNSCCPVDLAMVEIELTPQNALRYDPPVPNTLNC